MYKKVFKFLVYVGTRLGIWLNDQSLQYFQTFSTPYMRVVEDLSQIPYSQSCRRHRTFRIRFWIRPCYCSSAGSCELAYLARGAFYLLKNPPAFYVGPIERKDGTLDVTCFYISNITTQHVVAATLSLIRWNLLTKLLWAVSWKGYEVLVNYSTLRGFPWGSYYSILKNRTCHLILH